MAEEVVLTEQAAGESADVVSGWEAVGSETSQFAGLPKGLASPVEIVPLLVPPSATTVIISI